MNQTIAAISTPPFPGGIGIVRISGPRAREVAGSVFHGIDDLSAAAGYTAHYGRVYDGEELLDEAVALVFAAPRSYTGEDVVELSCHGGVYVVQRLLKAVLAAGARPAAAGEFTRRAFENGKLGLTQAEAVMDIISAGGKQALSAALAAKNGGIEARLREASDTLAFAAAGIAAFVDFPDEGLPEMDFHGLIKALSRGEEQLSSLLRDFEAGRVLREGVDAVIAGRPNVGKSTLMNLLSGSERSIVTEHAGTTRDVVEETVKLGEILLRLSDTAGLRDTDDPIEQIGVEKAQRRLEEADLILAVFDGSAPLAKEDRDLLSLLQGRPAVCVVNKEDLVRKAELGEIFAACPETVTVSAREHTGTEALTAAVERVTGVARLEPGAAVLQNTRQWDCARRALEAVRAAQAAIGAGVTLDAVGVELDEGIAALEELTGKRVSDRVVDEVFARFCVGK